MELAGALDESYTDRYSPPVGLLGQLLDVVRNTEQGRAGRPADAVGVSQRTWNAWIAGARGMPGGSRPSGASRERLAAAGRRARVNARPPATRAKVTGKINWNGYYNRRPYRTVNLDGLDLDPSAEAWAEGSPQAAADAFEGAVGERYGEPVRFEGDAVVVALT